MANVTTLDAAFRPLMNAPTVKLDRCAVCGRAWPLNEHHIVWRSWGNLYRDGKKVPKPTITLCGFGNDLHGIGPDGGRVTYCHGKVHHHLGHLRWVPHPTIANAGHLEWLETEEPTKYQDALLMDGWRPL